jgi:hypothetical protein
MGDGAHALLAAQTWSGSGGPVLRLSSSAAPATTGSAACCTRGALQGGEPPHGLTSAHWWETGVITASSPHSPNAKTLGNT